MAWIKPKTDWTISDSFNIEDFNRIKGNIEYIHNEAQLIYSEFPIDDMGEDITTYMGVWDVDKFNAFEKNLEIINENMIAFDIGDRQTFYQNGVFIGFAELNRIENATIILKTIIDGWYEAMAKLEFRLGNKGGIRT